MDYQNVFKRYELKYLMTKKQKEKLVEVMEPFMQPEWQLILEIPPHRVPF